MENRAATDEKSKRIKMYVRINPDVRRRFKSMANLASETIEARVERLMREDLDRNFLTPPPINS